MPWSAPPSSSPPEAPVFSKPRFEEFTEGRRAQPLHIGPFTEEGPAIQRIHQFIQARGSLAREASRNPPVRCPARSPRKWKTILRQPMQ